MIVELPNITSQTRNNLRIILDSFSFDLIDKTRNPQPCRLPSPQAQDLFCLVCRSALPGTVCAARSDGRPLSKQSRLPLFFPSPHCEHVCVPCAGMYGREGVCLSSTLLLYDLLKKKEQSLIMDMSVFRRYDSCFLKWYSESTFVVSLPSRNMHTYVYYPSTLSTY